MTDLTTMEPPNYLAILNAHPRDKDITFEEGPHIYTVCGDRGGYTSVTTWNHHHFSDFDADSTIKNIIRSISKSKDCYKIEFINDRFIESDSCQYKIGDTLYIKK